MRRHRRQNERGFALLLVFAMAAAAVVMLYLEMPRVAFEHERNKEALLVERGEEYVRAIQLYYKKYSKYPQTIEDLETTNNVRFLRRRYKDPMTNSDEWRLIHVDGAGQYTDSLIHKKTNDQEKSGPSVLSSNIVGVGASAEYLNQGQTQSAAAATRRASDRIIPGGPGSTSGLAGDQPQAQDPSQADAANSRSGPPAPPQQAQGQGQQGTNPFQVPQGQQGGNNKASGTNPQTGTPGQQNSSGNSSFGFGGSFGSGSQSSNQSGSSANPNANSNSSNNQSAFGNSSFGGSSSNRSGGNAAPNSAISAIQNMLTNPRQNSTMSGTGSGGMAAGAGGLVGVASKREMEGILVYNERTSIQEWEFVFDQKKALANQQGQANAQQQNQQNQQSGSSSGFSFGKSSSSSSSSSGSGSNPFGSSSGFGFGSSSGSSSGSSKSSGFGFGSTGTPAPASNGKQ